MDSKAERYIELVQRRKCCSRCKDELCNPALLSGYRNFDTEIGPWSRWQGNLNANLMIVGQDWGTVKYLREHYFTNKLEAEPSHTNKNLCELLNRTQYKN